MTPTYFDHTGIARRLGHRHNPAALRGLPRYGAGHAAVPESLYVEFNVWDQTPLTVKDQGPSNACNPHQEVLGLEESLYQDGGGYRPLDPWVVYALACQGDAESGTSFDQVLDVLTKYGAPPAGTVPPGTSDPRRVPPGAAARAAPYRVELSESVATRADLLSAVMRREPVGWPVCVADGFDDLDAEGVPRLSRGVPNHAVNLWGGARHSAKWGWLVLATNSWGVHWGVDGHFMMPVDRLSYRPEYAGVSLRAATLAVPKL